MAFLRFLKNVFLSIYFVLFFTATVLVAVPLLSGAADRNR